MKNVFPNTGGPNLTERTNEHNANGIESDGFIHDAGYADSFSVGCVIPLDRLRFPFNDMEISMIDICILDILIISILELFHAFFHAYKRGKAYLSVLISMEKLHAYHLGL